MCGNIYRKSRIYQNSNLVGCVGKIRIGAVAGGRLFALYVGGGWVVRDLETLTFCRWSPYGVVLLRTQEAQGALFARALIISPGGLCGRFGEKVLRSPSE